MCVKKAKTSYILELSEQKYIVHTSKARKSYQALWKTKPTDLKTGLDINKLISSVSLLTKTSLPLKEYFIFIRYQSIKTRFD
jgi:hypothetical protein